MVSRGICKLRFLRDSFFRIHVLLNFEHEQSANSLVSDNFHRCRYWRTVCVSFVLYETFFQSTNAFRNTKSVAVSMRKKSLPSFSLSFISLFLSACNRYHFSSASFLCPLCIPSYVYDDADAKRIVR